MPYTEMPTLIGGPGAALVQHGASQYNVKKYYYSKNYLQSEKHYQDVSDKDNYCF